MSYGPTRLFYRWWGKWEPVCSTASSTLEPIAIRWETIATHSDTWKQCTPYLDLGVPEVREF